jgi:hypothetical protein
MPLAWVTGTSGVGKSTACALLKSRREWAVDADWEGYSHWFDRTSGQIVTDPPDPLPGDWLARYGWRISRAAVEDLSTKAYDRTAFLCGSAENEADLWDLFDLMICLVVDNDTLRERLAARTTNAFGKHPAELVAALEWNEAVAPRYRGIGATIIDGTRTPSEVADAVLESAALHLPT